MMVGSKVSQIFLFVLLCVGCGKARVDYLPPQPEEPSFNCDEIQKYFGPTASDHVDAIDDITSRYKLIREFGEGRSGGRVYLVLEKETGLKKVLKIFPPHQLSRYDSATDFNFREVYFTCSNSNLLYLDYNSMEEVRGFPVFYALGNLKTQKPFHVTEGERRSIYPYMIVEYIDGMSMMKIAKEPSFAEKTLGFSYHPQYRDEIIYTLWQLAKTLETASKAYSFEHHDLHQDNVIIIRNKERLQVKVIDFGFSTSEAYRDTKWFIKFDPWRPANEEFCRIFRSLTECSADLLYASTHRYLGNDINMFNRNLASLNGLINPGNSPLRCESWQSCLQLPIFSGLNGEP